MDDHLKNMALDSQYYSFKDPLELIKKIIGEVYEDILKSLDSNKEIFVNGKKYYFTQVYTEEQKKEQDLEKINLTDFLFRYFLEKEVRSITDGKICELTHEEDCDCTFYGDRNQVVRILLDYGNTPNYSKVSFLMPKDHRDTCFPYNHLSDEDKEKCLREEFKIPEDRTVMIPPCTLCNDIYKVKD